jgi:hypothetical protein
MQIDATELKLDLNKKGGQDPPFLFHVKHEKLG